MNTTSVFCIGDNNECELGLGNITRVRKLTHINKLPKAITNIYSGFKFTVYSDENNKNIFVAGNNYDGECGVGNKKEDVSIPAQIQYFNNKNINIIKICVSVCGCGIFWISDQGQLYGNGANKTCELGIGDDTNRYEPVLIPGLRDVIDVRCGQYYSLALCTTDIDNIMIVLTHWTRYEGKHIPDDIRNVIIMFTKTNSVYSTQYSDDGGNGFMNNRQDRKWKEIDILNDKNIIQITAGHHHSLFLSADGMVYGCGKNKWGQLGLGQVNDQQIYIPQRIEWFFENDIVIRSISSGMDHNMALDENGRVYSWGDAMHGQCGHGETPDIITPKLIEAFDKLIVDTIVCGFNHSYCRTIDGRHWLFGRNMYNECLAYDGKSTVSVPFSINNVVESELNGKTIKAVSIGRANTKLIVGDK